MIRNETLYLPYRWIVLWVLWITYIVVFLNRLSVGPLAPFFKSDLTITSAQVGMIMSAAALGYTLSIFPIGWVVDKIGAKWPIVIGDMIAGLCMLVLFFAPSFFWLLTFMFITGLGCGFLLPSTTQAVIAWFPPRERATVMGLKQTAVNIGGIITAATLPALALAIGWRGCFLILGMVAIAIALSAVILYRDPPRSRQEGGKLGTPDTPVPLVEILKSREIWLLSVCGFCLTWLEMAVIAHLVLYLTEALSIGIVAAGILLAVTEAAGGIARPGSGFVSDRVFGGRRRPVFMLMAGTASLFSLIVALLGPKLSWFLYPSLACIGAGGIGFGGIYLTMLSEFGGKRGAGKAVGLGGMVALSGAAIGPTIFGHIVDVSSSYTWAWLSLSFISAVCLTMLSFVNEKKRKI